jgi:regulator of sigma E protease
MIGTIILFIIILGLLVFVHELGHFLSAKKSGMKVDEFGFGFPPRLIGVQKTGGKFKLILGHKDPEDTESTVYSINAIPLGGFVKIVGENNEEAGDSRSFINRPFFPRFITLAAGIIMNLILGWLLISGGYMVGLPIASDGQQIPPKARLSEQSTSIVEVVSKSPAEAAGLRGGDTIVSIDGQTFATLDETRSYIVEHKGETLEFVIKRGSEQMTP